MMRWMLSLMLMIVLHAQSQTVSNIGLGWSGNSINTVVFRRNAVVSHGKVQYAAYYDSVGNVVLAKRRLNSNGWQLKTTQYKGNIKDAHNSISIMVDGEGYLHMAWDHHGNKLRYCKSVQPGSLDLTGEMLMVAKDEGKVTYPEFYQLKNGDLLFLYRDGASGQGNLVLNRYYTKTKTWQRVHDNLIDGEGKRNAYWQACIDDGGTFHISWVWRESPDVASNHDMCYAKSIDGGNTWTTSSGKLYAMPINAQNAEYIARIPQKSELINSTSMTSDKHGNCFIATYWRPAGSTIPQYHLIYQREGKWTTQQVSDRKMPFSLSGAGTKRIPISRPQVLVKRKEVSVVFRDAERGDKVSVTTCNHLQKAIWNVKDLTAESVGQWEPTFDTELWKRRKTLHLFVQKTGQGDGERVEKSAPTMVSVIRWK
jgi:hypothetical protein